MDTSTISAQKYAAAGLAVLAAAIATGMAFAGWLNHGAEIFLTYASTGLAWCF